MTLFPLHAHERSPFGLVEAAAGVTYEGGMVGQITERAGAPAGEPEVTLWDDSAADLSLVGLIDDSTTAVQGRGVTGIGVTVVPGVTPETGSPTGPATHLASRKVTLWLDSGVFVTDVWDTTDVILGPALLGAGGATPVTVGTSLLVDAGGTAGLLQADAGTYELGQYLRSFTGGLDAVDDFDSYFLPRVQPLPEGRVFMVFRFQK